MSWECIAEMTDPLPCEFGSAQGTNVRLAIRGFRREEVWHGGVPGVKHPEPPGADPGNGRFEPDRRCRLSIGFSPLGEAMGLWYELVDNAGRSLLSARGRSGSDP